jgi:hypothetical protein
MGRSRTSSTERKSESDEVLNRQGLCPAGRINLQSLQCPGNTVKFIPLISQGIDERFSSMCKCRFHERAKCDFLLLAEPCVLIRSQQHDCRSNFRSGTETLG